VKLKLLRLFLVIGLLVFMNGCGRKNYGLEPKPKDQVILRLADVFNTEYPSTAAGVRCARLIAAKTKGRIKVRLFENGELGDELSVIEQVQFGGIDLARVNMAVLFEYLKKYQLLLTPGLYRDSAHLQRVLNGTIGMKVGNELLKEKIVLLCWYDVGNPGFYNYKRKLKTSTDFQGLKLGVTKAQLIRDYINRLSGWPVSLEPGEVLGQLQNRTIDGAYNNLVIYWSLHHYEIAQFYTVDSQTFFPDVLIGSRVAMMQLTKTDQQIIMQAARQSVNFQKKEWNRKYQTALVQLKQAGVSINTLKSGVQPKKGQSSEMLDAHLSSSDRELLRQIRKLR
jgi:TRAP-type C4-dicarboxylate transport system substrate-binding protein